MKLSISSFGIILFVIAFFTNPFVTKAQAPESFTIVTHTDKNFNTAVQFLLNGELDEAIIHFKKAQEYYLAQKNYRQVTECYLGLTNCYFFQGNYATALQFCEQALALHKQEIKDDAEGLDALTIAHSLCKAALAYEEQKSNTSTEIGMGCLEM